MPDPRELIEDGVRAERAGALDRALDRFARAAELASDAAVKTEALRRMADVHRARSNWTASIEAAKAAHDTAQRAGLREQTADATIAEANAWLCRGEFTVALPIFRRVLVEHASPRLRGIALQNIGAMQAQMGRYADAEKAFEEGQRCLEEAGYERGVVMSLANRGRVALDGGDIGRSLELLNEALEAARSTEDHELIALCMLNKAAAWLAAGDADRAGEHLTAAFGYFASAGNRWRQIECLKLMGQIEERQGDSESASRCYERGLRLAGEVGTRVEAEQLRGALGRISAPFSLSEVRVAGVT